MDTQLRRILAGMFALALAVLLTLPARAQMSEVKEKAPMYTYVADWSIPRAQWGDMEKNMAADQSTLQKALASGTIVAYGDDEAMVHQSDGATHDNWWSAMSMAGLLNVLDQFYKNGGATAPVLASATKHFDSIYVSRYYNWHSGSWKGVYTHGSNYQLKPDAANNAVETLSKSFLVPFLRSCWLMARCMNTKLTLRPSTRNPPACFTFFTSRRAPRHWTRSMRRWTRPSSRTP